MQNDNGHNLSHDQTGTALHPLIASLRAEARDVPASGIVETLNHARGKEDIVPLWVGEGSLPTPRFICEAVSRSLQAGETFYTYQRGIPELREAIASYHQRLYGKSFDPERFVVTGSGMQAIQIAVRMVAGPGDEVVLPTPAWPNLAAAVTIASANPVEVPMDFSPDGWQLDLERLFQACGPKTKAIFLNSPANPTGWTASLEELQQILDFARARGLWIIADEIYTRFYWREEPGRSNAPSFHEIAEPDDRILFVNSFSKNWAMTGWRIGWIAAPAIMGDVLENLVQYSTSGVASFMQRAGIAALEEGEAFLAEQIERAKTGRQKLIKAFSPHPSLRFAAPDGAFYMFFGLEGREDSAPLVMQLIDEANVGLAPGFAFGQSGSAFMRLCFATNPALLDKAITRFEDWMKSQ